MSKQRILLVDDDQDDQLLFRDALGEISSEVNCTIAGNGLEALNSLSSPPHPDLIFLDLNMPVMNGFEFLAEMRKKEDLKKVPVVVFTTTSDPATVKQLHDLGANAFFKKPNNFSSMQTKLQALIETDFTRKAPDEPFSIHEFCV